MQEVVRIQKRFEPSEAQLFHSVLITHDRLI